MNLRQSAIVRSHVSRSVHPAGWALRVAVARLALAAVAAVALGSSTVQGTTEWILDGDVGVALTVAIERARTIGLKPTECRINVFANDNIVVVYFRPPNTDFGVTGSVGASGVFGVRIDRKSGKVINEWVEK